MIEMISHGVAALIIDVFHIGHNGGTDAVPYPFHETDEDGVVVASRIGHRSECDLPGRARVRSSFI
jgi:hypothetical protein